MKTNLVICLALLAATTALPAEQGRAFQGKARLQHSAMKRVMPTPQARISTTKVTKSPAPHRTVPGKIIRPAGSVTRNTNTPADNRIPGNSAALHNGLGVANGVHEMSALRNSGLENLRENFGTGSNQPRGQQPETDPFANNNFTPRDPKAPASVAHGDSGLTDIRSGFDRSRQGHVSAADVFRSGFRSSFGPGSGFTGTTGSGHSESAMTPSDDTNGSTSSVDFTYRDGTTGTYSVTETHDNNGGYVSVEHTEYHKQNGEVLVRETRRDGEGNVVSTTESSTTSDGTGSSMTTYPDGTATVETHPIEESCDRSPEGASTGGPVGPSAATLSGLVPLDLLRQRANGESNGSGPGQYSIAGRTGANQVLPGGTAHTPGPRVAGQNTVVNPGPIDSTPGSGDDRP